MQKALSSAQQAFAMPTADVDRHAAFGHRSGHQHTAAAQVVGGDWLDRDARCSEVKIRFIVGVGRESAGCWPGCRWWFAKAILSAKFDPRATSSRPGGVASRDRWWGRPYCFFMPPLLPSEPPRNWRDHVVKTFGLALLLASGLAITAAPARALQIVVTQVDKNTDGSMTYHFTVKTDQGETLTPGDAKETSDFVTVYNFYGLVDGSTKSPAGWEFSSEEFGRTPYWNGYPLVLPVDVPGTPNLTWTVTKPVPEGAQIDGFTATTRASGMVYGEYTAQVTQESPAVAGVAAGTPGAEVFVSKQALIGWLLTPSFLADVK
jgi:hypothetical protein